MRTRTVAAAGFGLFALAGCHYSPTRLAQIGAGSTSGAYTVVASGPDYTTWSQRPASFRVTACAGRLRDLNHGQLTTEIYDYCGLTPSPV
jgi:hypothetical protein